jgi:hypothetical protein
MSGDPKGGDRDDADQFRSNLAFERQFGGDPTYVASQPYTVGGKTRIPVLNEKGQQVGYTSAPVIPSLAAGVLQALTGEAPQVYTGDSRYNPNANQGKVLQNFYNLDGTVEQRYVDPDGGGGGASQTAADPFAQQRAELAAARANRANALANKQSQLAAAFGAFNDDFYEDLSSSYTEYQNPLLTQSYDDSLRGIYEGFKAKGLLSQSDVNAAISGLDAARDRERNRITQGATAYSDARRNEVAAKQKKLSDQLAGLVGGATTAADVNAQTEAINAFDFSGEVDKLTKPAAKGDLNFFEGFDKVTAAARPTSNVSAVSATGTPQGAESIQAGRQATGIRSPYQGSSLKVVS